MLQFRTFLPANDKVKQVEFHPVQPWVAVVSKSNSVTIWDWASLKAIQELQMGGYDEEAAMEQNLAKLADKDPSLGRAPLSLQSPVSRLQSGSVKQVKFFDADTAYYQLVGGHTMVNGSGTPPPSTPAIRALSSHSLLVMACENKVVVLDLVSRKSMEVPRAALENKQATCVAFLLPQSRHAALLPSASATSPILAVGLSDGSARLIQLSNLKILAKLPPAHKAGLCEMVVVPSKTGDLLLAGDTSGNVMVWEPFAKPLGMGAGDIPHKVSIQAHKDKEILSLCVGYAAEDVGKTVPRLFTAAMDNRVASWELGTWKEVTRQKVDSKTPVMGLAFGARNYSSIGSHNLTLATGTSVVFAMHAQTGSVRHVCNLNGIIPAGSKKIPKIYCVAQHPLQPHMVVVGANSGAAILSYDAVYLPPATRVLGDTTAPSLIDPLGSLGESSNISYATILGQDLWTATATPHIQEEAGVVRASGKVTASTKIGTVSNSGKAWISVSYDGQYVSVAWPIARTYTIYHRTTPTSWQECDKGSGVCVAWCSYSNRYAVLEEPQVAAMPEPSKPKKMLGKNKGPDPAALRAAMEAASAAAAANTRVVIKELNGKITRVVNSEVRMQGDVPSYLHGGPVLGVVYRRTAANTWELSEGNLQSMQFYSWDSASKVGGELPEPMWMSWDKSNQHVAMAYPTQVMLCAARPTFHPLVSLPLPNATSAAWDQRQLFIATSTHVMVAYVMPPHHPIVPLAGVHDPKESDSSFQLVPLAAFDAVEPLAGDVEGGKEAGLPHLERRPPGPLVVLGTGGGYLWLLNSQGQPIPLSLSHAGLKARNMAASGDFQGAALVAESRITPQDHDGIATFLCEMGGRAGAQAALSLSGLSLATDIEVSVRAGQWERAVQGCRAILAGCTHRPNLFSVVTAGVGLTPSINPTSTPGVPPAGAPGLSPLGIPGLPSPRVSAAGVSPGMVPGVNPLGGVAGLSSPGLGVGVPSPGVTPLGALGSVGGAGPAVNPLQALISPPAAPTAPNPNAALHGAMLLEALGQPSSLPPATTTPQLSPPGGAPPALSPPADPFLPLALPSPTVPTLPSPASASTPAGGGVTPQGGPISLQDLLSGNTPLTSPGAPLASPQQPQPLQALGSTPGAILGATPPTALTTPPLNALQLLQQSQQQQQPQQALPATANGLKGDGFKDGWAHYHGQGLGLLGAGGTQGPGGLMMAQAGVGVVKEDGTVDIDWTLPIKQAVRARQATNIRGNTGPGRGSTTAASAASTTADPAAIDAVMRVADAALAAGLRDAAQRIVGLLLEAASALPVSTLGRVAVRVQEVGLKQQMSALHSRLGTFATCSEEASGLFSAAVCGDPAVLQAALGQGKAPALAALQAANFRLMSAMGQETSWNHHLRSVGGLESMSGLRFQVSQYRAVSA